MTNWPVTRALRGEFNLALNLHRNIERQLGHAHGAAAVGSDFGAEQFEDQIREPVDDAGLLAEARCRVHHAKHARPAGYAVQATRCVTQCALQAAQNRQRGEAGGGVALLQRHLPPQLAQRLREGAVRVLRPVAGDQRAVANDPNRLKRQNHAGRRLHGQRQRQPQGAQPAFNF